MVLCLLVCVLAACTPRTKSGVDYSLSHGDDEIAIRFERLPGGGSGAGPRGGSLYHEIVIRNVGKRALRLNADVWLPSRVIGGDLVHSMEIAVNDAPAGSPLSAPDRFRKPETWPFESKDALVTSHIQITGESLPPGGESRFYLEGVDDLDRIGYQLHLQWLEANAAR